LETKPVYVRFVANRLTPGLDILLVSFIPSFFDTDLNLYSTNIRTSRHSLATFNQPVFFWASVGIGQKYTLNLLLLVSSLWVLLYSCVGCTAG
jgi:hypothetical protein